MKFDAYAVLAELRSEGGGRAIRATCAIQPAPWTAPNSTNSTNSTARPADTARSEAVPCSTNSTNSTGQADDAAAKVIAWPGRGYPPEAIRQGVAEAFEDWEAMNDPHDARAWA